MPAGFVMYLQIIVFMYVYLKKNIKIGNNQINKMISVNSVCLELMELLLNFSRRTLSAVQKTKVSLHHDKIFASLQLIKKLFQFFSEMMRKLSYIFFGINLILQRW